MIAVPMQVSTTAVSIPMSVTDDGVSIAVSIGAAYVATEGKPYDGHYIITPSSEEQVLETDGKLMLDNVVINPIPQNYGLVTWNGSELTIS